MTGAVRAVVVHHDQPDRCRRTVALLHQQRAPGVDLDVVIVDNASEPAARAVLDGIGGARIIDSGWNAGFGGGANVGLREWLAEPEAGEWALVLPHDAEPEPACLATMLRAVDGIDDAGLVSAEYGDDQVPVIDKIFGALTVPSERGDGFRPSDYAHGTFLLLRRSCLLDVGLFDERYFAYCEEADLALRARARGWRSGIVWGAIVNNPHQGSSTAVVDYLMVRNTIRLVRDHFGRSNAAVRLVIAAVGTPWHALRPGARTSPWFDARARLLAVRDVLLGRVGSPPASLAAR